MLKIKVLLQIEEHRRHYHHAPRSAFLSWAVSAISNKGSSSLLSYHLLLCLLGGRTTVKLDWHM